MKIKKLCTYGDCKEKHFGRGYCKRHYWSFKYHGHPIDITIFDRNEIIINKEYAEIVLRNRRHEIVGKTKIDIDDVEKIKNIKCFLHHTGYAYFHITGDKTASLHRYIANTSTGRFTDHINGNRLDNRKINLRYCNRSENAMNKKVSGVGWHKLTKKWCAYIGKNKQQYHLGLFETKEEAVVARRKKEKELFGKFSYNHENL